ncbi:MAG: hypothetical protein JJE52_18080 [Acidimicrobiia bacterium]|nr:hypothetical protein [Acidimicrobiia bacterium]
MPHWLGGLDGSTNAYAFVRFWVPDLEGRPTLPTLQVWDLDDTLRHEVPLPDAIGWMTFVDLSDDGGAALVWSRDWQTGQVSGPVYVDGLDTETPRVRAVATDHAVRFS